MTFKCTDKEEAEVTVEVERIIAFHEASGLDGDVTDINTPGVHSATSHHYAKGTRSEPWVGEWTEDVSDGSSGCAVDFGFKPIGKPDSPELLAIHLSFMRRANDLKECFYAGPGTTQVVLRGKTIPLSELPKDIRSAHRNHVHVAVAKGTFLEPPIGLHRAQDDDEEQKENEVKEEYRYFPCPTGGYWELKLADGGVGNHDDAPFFGAMPGVATVVAPLVGMTPLVQDGLVTGYWIFDVAGHVYSFGAAPHYSGYAEHPEWHGPDRLILGLVQTDGWRSGEKVRYKQLGRQKSDSRFVTDEYHLPAGRRNR